MADEGPSVQPKNAAQAKLLDECVAAFNMYNFQMLHLVINKTDDGRSDKELAADRDILRSVVRGNNFVVIDTMGKYIYLFREKILARDSQWFKNFDYSKIIDNDGHGPRVIQKLLSKWPLFTKKEHTIFADAFNALLTLYIGYKYCIRHGEFPPGYELPPKPKLPPVKHD